VGASRPEQLQENTVASGLTVDADLFRKAEAIVAGAARGA
jgi:aryl-alcohol dehydrogenase-like predicted oxidoreductase